MNEEAKEKSSVKMIGGSLGSGGGMGHMRKPPMKMKAVSTKPAMKKVTKK